MGSCFSQEPDVDFSGPVDFNHFHILRAIGKGAFGKVCIVKKKDTKQMYAMKYMNKIQIIRKHAVENVFREIKILCSLEHPFLVNLWFTFQDREDMFLVMDLMLGGDISYHLEKHGKFSLPRVRLYIAEVALALEYLRSKSIVHRDIKPANMLLDSQGHVHVTDFNVASIVRPNVPITSTTGTKPYMAPEVVQAPSTGYLYAVDWWSLGVSAYEMLRGHRPFSIEKSMSTSALYNMLMHTRPSASANWDTQTCDVLKMLLHPDASKRLQTADSMRTHPFFEELSWKEVEDKTAVPPFIPPQNRINCDPTHELEEMIVEPNPLHKKRHRLSKRTVRTEEEAIEIELNKIENQFRDYNRERDEEGQEEDSKLPDIPSNNSADSNKVLDSSKAAELDGASNQSDPSSKAVPTDLAKPAVEAKSEGEVDVVVKDREKDRNSPVPDSSQPPGEVNPEVRDNAETGGGEKGAQQEVTTPVSPSADSAMDEGFTRDTTPLVNGSPLDKGRTPLTVAEGGND